jgi:hypothetical protein
MPDKLTPQELAAHRAYLALHRPDCRCTGSRLLAHIDALTAAVVPVVRAYLANDEKGLQGALADLSAESILRGEQ